MKRLKQKLGTAWLAILFTCCGLLLLAGVFLGLFGWARSASLPQQAYQWWQNGAEEGRFAQISVFLGKDAGFTIESMMKLRQDVDKKLQENSIAAPSANARLWLDAYSAEQSLSVSTDRASATVLATGVGGDFFFFHPYTMMSGQYLQADEILQDLVLIDWDLAWRLYGAYEVVGFPITVGGMPCYVGGVLRAETDWPESRTYGGTGRIFMSYDLLNRMDRNLEISCVEMILPDPVSGFAKGIAEGVIGVDESNMILLENSSRYRLLTLIKKLGDFGMDEVRTKPLALPYWENAARIAESYALLFLMLAVVMLLFPAVIAVILLGKAWKRKGVYAKAIVHQSKKTVKRIRRNKKPEIQEEEPPLPEGEEQAADQDEEAQVHA